MSRFPAGRTLSPCRALGLSHSWTTSSVYCCRHASLALAHSFLAMELPACTRPDLPGPCWSLPVARVVPDFNSSSPAGCLTPSVPACRRVPAAQSAVVPCSTLAVSIAILVKLCCRAALRDAGHVPVLLSCHFFPFAYLSSMGVPP
jgi:hypothetical protein